MRLLVLAGCLGAVLAGCDSEPGREGSSASADENTTIVQPAGGTEGEVAQEAPEDAKVGVVESGFTQKKDNLLYGLVVENTSGVDATGVDVSVNVLDDRGDVIADDNPAIAVVPARATFNVGGEIQIEAGGRAQELEVTIDVEESIVDEFGLPEVENVRVSEDKFGLGMTIRAQVTNTLDKTLSSITDVFAVLRDSSGNIVGGTSSLALDNELKPGRRASVEVMVLTVLDDVVSADLSVDNEVAFDE